MTQPSTVYSVARIHALEHKLMDRMRIERMVEAASAADALKILGESGEYGQALTENPDPRDFEKALAHDRASLFRLLETVSPNRAVTDLFFLRHDITNLKILYKARHLGREHGELLSPLGLVPVEELQGAVREQEYGALPEYLQACLPRLEESFRDRVDPQGIDVILDRAMYGEILRVCDREKERICAAFFREEIDWHNIRSLFRTRKAGFDGEFFSRVFIGGGTLEEIWLRDAFSKDARPLSETLAGTPYHALFQEAETLFAESGDISTLERMVDNRLLERIRRASRDNYDGIEPVIGYILAKEYEARAVRIIMVGKLNRMPRETIRERLRDTYV